MIARYIAGQFRKPMGLLGRLIGNGMARGNAAEQNWTLSLLQIQPADHILEIGFGPGTGIEAAARQATLGFVAGIDVSQTMVQMASKRNAAAIAAGRVDLRLGSVTSLPFPGASLDKALTVHCIYFWPNALDGLREVLRVIKPGGWLAVTILPKVEWAKKRPVPPDLYTLYEGSEVAQLLSAAGFRNVRVEQYPRAEEFRRECILGTK